MHVCVLTASTTKNILFIGNVNTFEYIYGVLQRYTDDQHVYSNTLVCLE